MQWHCERYAFAMPLHPFYVCFQACYPCPKHCFTALYFRGAFCIFFYSHEFQEVTLFSLICVFQIKIPFPDFHFILAELPRITLSAKRAFPLHFDTPHTVNNPCRPHGVLALQHLSGAAHKKPRSPIYATYIITVHDDEMLMKQSALSSS